MKKSFYRYSMVLVFCSLLMVMVSVGIGVSGWGTLTVSICNSLKISRQQFSRLYSVIFLGSMVSSLALGTFVNKILPKKIMTFGAVAMPSALIFISKSGSLVGLYIGGFAIGFCLPMVSFYMVSLLMANWFMKERGKFTGIAFMGSGIGGLILIPIINAMNLSYGWQNAVLVLAIICGVVLFTASRFIIFAPEELGWGPDGESKTLANNHEAHPAEGAELKELWKSRRFWLILVFVSASYMVMPLTSTITPFLMDSGFSNHFSTLVYSASTGAIALCRLLCGKLCDKLGHIYATVITAAMSLLLMLGLVLVPYLSIMAIFIIVGAGMCNALPNICFPLLATNFYGKKDYSRILGLISAVGELASVLCPILYGSIYARTGSYYQSYILLLIFLAVGMICYFSVLPSYTRKTEE